MAILEASHLGSKEAAKLWNFPKTFTQPLTHVTASPRIVFKFLCVWELCGPRDGAGNENGGEMQTDRQRGQKAAR